MRQTLHRAKSGHGQRAGRSPERTSASGGHWLDELVDDAAQVKSSVDTGAGHHDDWRVFAALAAMPLRAAEPALSPPS